MAVYGWLLCANACFRDWICKHVLISPGLPISLRNTVFHANANYSNQSVLLTEIGDSCFKYPRTPPPPPPQFLETTSVIFYFYIVLPRQCTLHSYSEGIYFLVSLFCVYTMEPVNSGYVYLIWPKTGFV